MIETYLQELAQALRVRGRARRRLLRECREHLADLAGERGERAAVAAFGAPAALATAFNLEVAARRGSTAAVGTIVAVLAVGGSTLAVIHSADAGATAPLTWAVLFWLGAQVSAVCAGLALLQGLALRRAAPAAGDVVLLCRRMALALAFAGLAMFSAAAGLTGRGSPAALLGGPVLALVAAVAVARAWRPAHRLAGASERADRSPFADMRALTGLRVPSVGPLGIAAVAAVAASLRDSGEAASSLGTALAVGGMEAVLVLLAYAALRAPLGLRHL